MASLILLANENNKALVRAMQAQGQDVKMKNTIDGLLIYGERIEITKDLADRVLGLGHKSEADANIIWRSLILNRQGKLVQFNNDKIIIADEEEKGEWSSIRIRRSTKDLVEKWAQKLNMSQAQLFDMALHEYIKSFTQEELEKLQQES